MLLQQSPFRGEDEDEIYDAVLADEPLYPIHMPRDSVSILQKLLIREPDLRLGSGPTDAQEIMSHAFFRNVNWDDIRDKKVAPPFQPQIKNPTDTSNFDSEFTSVTPVLTPVQSGKSSQCVYGNMANMGFSFDTSNARRVPRLFIFGGFHMRPDQGGKRVLKEGTFPRTEAVRRLLLSWARGESSRVESRIERGSEPGERGEFSCGGVTVACLMSDDVVSAKR